MGPVDFAALEAALARHEGRACLQVSGGKDSLAALYLLRPYWERLLVAWLDSGDCPVETRARMALLACELPHFLRVEGQQPAVVAAYGLPVDLLPPEATPAHGPLMHPEAPKLQARYDCCARVMWAPMQAALDARGITLFLRGQKHADPLRPAYGSGYTDAAGREVFFPIEAWSEAEVLGFLAAEGIALPAFYRYGRASIDCASCTAYLGEGRRGAYLRDHEPRAYGRFRHNLITVQRLTAPYAAETAAELQENLHGA